MHIYFGEIAYRNVEVGHAQSIIDFAVECSKIGVPLTRGFVVGDALVSRSRSVVASNFLRHDADVLLTIDSDIVFMPQDALALCDRAMELGVVGALYMTRALQTQPALMLPSDELVGFVPGEKPIEVPFISGGFMAVRRDVLEKIRETLPECHKSWRAEGVPISFWPFYMPYVIPWGEGDGHMYLSEDWALCQRAKDAGFKVYLDPTIRLGHIGQTTYTLENLIQQPRPKPEPLALRRNGDGDLQTIRLKEALMAGARKE